MSPQKEPSMELGPPMVTELCSAYDDVHKVTCDLPRKHRGPHQARLFWGDEESGDD